MPHLFSLTFARVYLIQALEKVMFLTLQVLGIDTSLCSGLYRKGYPLFS